MSDENKGLEALINDDSVKKDQAFFEKLYAVGYNYYQLSQYEEAHHFFNYLIDINPTEARYYFGLAACLQQMKQYLSAIEVYTLILQDNPAEIKAYFHIGECFLYLENKEMAKQVFETLLTLEQHDSQGSFKELFTKARNVVNQLAT